MPCRVIVACLALLLATPAPAQEAAEEGKPFLELRLMAQSDLVSADLKSGSRRSRLPANNGIASFPADTRVDIRRLRTGLRLNFTGTERMDVSVSYDTRGQEWELSNAYFQSELRPGHLLRLGQFKTHFGYEAAETSAWDLNTIERSDVSRALHELRDIGIGFSGESKELDWHLDVVLGQGQNQADLNPEKDVIAKVVYRPTDAVELGLSGRLGTFRLDGEDLPVRRVGAEARWKEGPWRLYSELIYGQGHNAFAGADVEALGALGTAVYRFADGWDAVLHLDWLDPDLGRAVDRQPDNASDARSRLVLGLNHTFDEEIDHRIMVNYELHFENEGPSVPNDGPRVRYQFRF